MLGVSPPATEGLTVLREMQEENLPTRVVASAGGIDEQEIAEAIRLGARGVVLKEMAPRLLLQCIRKVHAGGEWFETRSIGHLVGGLPPRRRYAQQSRGADTARDSGRAASGAGPDRQVIAQSLSIAKGTVKVHLHLYHGSRRVRNRVELLLHAREKGWV